MSNKMDTVKTLLPKLRFPEFENSPAWKKTPLEDAVSPVVRQVEKPENSYTGLGIRSHGKGTFLKPFESPEKNAMEYLYEVQSDDLIVNITFAWEGAIAIVKQGDSGALVSHRFPTYTFNRDVAIPEFFQYVILDKRFIYNLGVISPGGAGRNRVLNKNDFLKLTVSVPSTAEQQKIADCLTSLDDLIAAQSQKVAALQAYKKGLMQNLFPAEGESVPRLRFPEFESAGEWEEKTLGKAATFYNGKAYKQEELLEHGKYRVLRVGNFFTNNNWYYSDLELDETKYCENGDLLYAWSASFGPRIWHGEKVIYHYHIWKVVAEKNINKDFLYLVLDFETEKIRSQSANGLGLLHITKATIENWKCMFPKDPNEQQRIAELLSALDEEISAQGESLAALKVHKRGLMQGLFPSGGG